MSCNRTLNRYKAVVEYDGCCFCGFQKQNSSLQTVQQLLETAIFKLTSENVVVVGAGRTDTGVHARGQVIHFDLSKEMSLKVLHQGMNFYLEDISVLSLEEVSMDFHARFNAIQRSYEYHIVNRPVKLALEKNRAWHVFYSLDVEKIYEGTKIFLGQHNFSAFKSSRSSDTRSERTIDVFDVVISQDRIVYTVKARSFLHHQVRMMVGTLIWYAAGKITKQNIQDALRTGVKKNIGPTAPSQGLYFMDVLYNNDLE